MKEVEASHKVVQQPVSPKSYFLYDIRGRIAELGKTAESKGNVGFFEVCVGQRVWMSKCGSYLQNAGQLGVGNITIFRCFLFFPMFYLLVIFCFKCAG